MGTLQELLVGGAVAAAGVAAVYNSMQGEPEICSLCAGTGGVKCFVCEGSGKLAADREALPAASAAARQRDPVARRRCECVACKGAGLIFCKQCTGSGYSTVKR